MTGYQCVRYIIDLINETYNQLDIIRSYNLTRSAALYNQENVISIENEFAVEKFVSEF